MFDELISKSRILASPWREVVDGCAEQSCVNFFKAFSDKAKELGDDSEHSLPLHMLSAICSMTMHGHKKGGSPFNPLLVMEGKRTFLPEDLTEAQTEELYLFLDIIQIPELKSRIADTLWVAKKNQEKHKTARVAIEEYIKAGEILLDESHAIRGVERLERAVAISAELGRGGIDEMKRALAACWGALRELSKGEINATQLRLIQTISMFGSGKNYQLGGICFDLSEKIDRTANNWDLVRAFWEQTAVIFDGCGCKEVAAGARKRMAWTYVKQVASAKSNLIKAHFLASAIEAFRRIHESKTKIDVLHKWLLRIEELTSNEMGEISVGPIDLTDCVVGSQEKVSGKSTRDALIAFSCIAQLNDPSKLKEQAMKDAQQCVVSSLLGSEHVNADGKVVAKSPPMVDHEESDEEALLGSMLFHFDLNCRLQIMGAIEPARRQLMREHSLSVEDLWPIVTNNPFIPQGQEMIFARGLSAGFEGDFLVATHLLVPQVENSLRYIIKQRGGLPSTINAHGIQQERMINALLDYTLIPKTLGERVVFSLRALLVEKIGANFRHSLCHGLFEYNYFYSHSAVYVWWLVFRICYSPWLNAWLKETHGTRER